MYQYVKGKGWVLSTVESVEFVSRKGNKFRLEKRIPEPGETYTWHSRQSDGTPTWDLDAWVSWGKIYAEISDRVAGSLSMYYVHYDYCVVIKCTNT